MRAGIQQYAAEGFPGEWELHHQGGLTGYSGRYSGREIFATPSSLHPIAPRQAFAWNPSITRVKSEDTILVADDGFEVLTRTQRWPDKEVDGATIERPSLLIRDAP